ncbi:methyl-accepting chemotaxis protein [Thalassomonas viridans]|uniref:Methyl-accepting chemotaxis protein n=1 Tax=Thalassomonas viridans TaxID=137584 RepID=A0AAE9Z4P3_9GAMM|nr:methyl-accepting chemotaxis protein [Thalassomonas viridans]WDE06558.1 methyl-accepting chemotaxis protein [Thalassomonas viridans]
MILKVAHKVILGFTFILISLLVSSISSIGILTEIGDSTRQVDELAIPVLGHSNAIQIQLLKQGKLSALIATTSTTEALSGLKTRFELQGTGLSEQHRALTGMLSEAKNKQFLQAFNGHYQNYTGSVDAMFAAREGELNLTRELRQQQSILDDHLNEASALLVDLSYLEDEEKQQQIDRIIGAAGQTEGYTINLTEATKLIISLENPEEVTEAQQTIQIAIANISQQLAFLVRLGEEYDTGGLIEQFVEEFNSSKAKLTGENNLFDLKIRQLEHMASLNRALGQSELEIEQAVEAIDALLASVDKNLSQLQLAVFDNVETGQTTTYVILVLLFVIGLGIAFFTVRAMIGPLRGINRVLSFIAQGDLSRQLKVRSDDEFGELSRNVNRVVADLRKLIADIGDNTRVLNTAAEQSSKEVTEVTRTLLRQKDTVLEVTAVTDELGLSADDVLAKANNAEQQMDSALQQSGELKGLASTTSEHMGALVKTLDLTSQVMLVLQQESTNISSILETIRSISDQTNLLALNAAIEAARAGEAGRGFAVVADEVRMLASRTQESAGEIDTMIQSLQSKTASAVADIANGKDEANKCQQHTDQLLNTLVMITEAIAEMHRMSSEIAQSATLQNNLSNNINTSIQDVVAYSQQSSDKSSSTQDYIKQVAQLAGKLDASVDAFKVQ